jgi:hypothetical protein
MKTATFSPPPRPPKGGRSTGNLGEPDGGSGIYGRRPWWRMILKFAVLVLFAVAACQLVLIFFQTVRLRFFA